MLSRYYHIISKNRNVIKPIYLKKRDKHDKIRPKHGKKHEF
ncbi:MAG: hypothetical protein UT33_C0013G0025 [Candidatus Peregrinibacteria bacterium GW2011_GWC2_39_14]|nr:MAG: hypothetical protein UT33_C0013G0025 [Candidatus Peregrinibacteria bacterium GW2011_GWC2_39_14]